jgi:hypothetical protein
VIFQNYIIENIEFPQNIESLIFKGCSFVQNLRTLPQNLKRLEIIGGEIRSINFLPKSLEILNCYQCKVRSIDYLPESLKELYCNQIKVLPNLPNSLTVLDCEQCNFISMKSLPPTLKILNCSYNEKLTYIPKLPQTLEKFEYNGCTSLRSHPDIPSSLLKSQETNVNNLQENQRKKTSLKKIIAYYICFIDS